MKQAELYPPDALDLAMEAHRREEDRLRAAARRAPRPCPQETPLCSVNGDKVGYHVIRFWRSHRSREFGRPLGAKALQVWMSLSRKHHQPCSLKDAILVGEFKRSPARIALKPEHDGLRVRYLMRWIGNEQHDVGPVVVCDSITVASVVWRAGIPMPR